MKLQAITYIFLVLSVFFSPAGISSAAAPEKAKDFALSDLEGRTFRLSDARGKVVLINFWATWCTYCVRENPALDRLYVKLKDRGFSVLSVSVDRKASTLRDYLGKTPLSYPVLLDSKGKVFVKLYTVVGIPVTYIIDRDGYIVESLIGGQDFDSERFVQKITSLLDSGGTAQ